VHADFGTQPAEGVLALDMQGCTFDAGDFASGQLHDGGVEAALVGPAQVHAQQHVGPILGLGTARAGLDIQVGIVRVHFTAEHAAKFHFLEDIAQALDFGGNVIDRCLIFFFGGHLQQIAGIDQTAVEVVERVDDQRQGGAFAAQILRVLGVIPDVRVFQLAVYFD
jgi:hypothetical protein